MCRIFEKTYKEPQPIVFHPKYEIGDSIVFRNNFQMVKGKIEARIFSDYGENETTIQYRIAIDIKSEIRDENQIWRNLKEYRKELKGNHKTNV